MCKFQDLPIHPPPHRQLSVCIGESTAVESMRRLVISIVQLFEDEYLRAPNQNDTSRLLANAEKRGFPSMLGCIDCMHWK
jgi:hypothetical protein